MMIQGCNQMSSFTTPLDVRFLDGKNWKLLEKFEYYIGEKENNNVIKIPKGFITDFASIPRIFWTIIGHPTGKYGKSAVIHDWLYRKGIGTRKQADKIFLDGMKVLRVFYLRRWTIYFAVRLFAFGSWKGK